MTDPTRRRFLQCSGALLGGLAVGSSVTAAASTDRFVVDANGVDLAGSDLAVVHDLSAVDLAVVEGTESAVESLGTRYAPDVALSLDLPVGRQSSELADEPYAPLQWDKSAQDLGAAHEVTRGEGSRVAVIDTGVDPFHPDLRGAVNPSLSANVTGDDYSVGGADFADVGYHGTHVSGIVAADDRNDVGVAGSAPATDLVALRVFSEEGGASFADVLAAVVYAASVDCDVANLSLGAYPVPRKGLGSFYGKVLNRITAFARRQGTLLVVAAGNDAADLQHDGGVVSIPNEAANVVSVSATGPVGYAHGDPGLEAPPTTPAVYTNYGTNAVDLSAPGGNYDPQAAANDAPGWYYDLVFNTIPTWLGGYAWLAGTSMAAPQVAGAAGLVAAAGDDRSANQLRTTLEGTARDVGDRRYHGSGFVDPAEAVRD